MTGNLEYITVLRTTGKDGKKFLSFEETSTGTKEAALALAYEYWGNGYGVRETEAFAILIANAETGAISTFYAKKQLDDVLQSFADADEREARDEAKYGSYEQQVRATYNASRGV